MEITPPSEDIEATEAASEFATLIKNEERRVRSESCVENYEVRPCARVRGYTLKLPVLGWKLWYPTVTDAVKFARRVATAHRAGCFIYDATGQLDMQPQAPN